MKTKIWNKGRFTGFLFGWFLATTVLAIINTKTISESIFQYVFNFICIGIIETIFFYFYNKTKYGKSI